MMPTNSSAPGGFFGSLAGSNLLPWLGLMAGRGQAAAPSRLPVTNGQVFGSLAGGLMGGIGAAQSAQLRAAQMQRLQAMADLYRTRGGVPAPAAPTAATAASPLPSALAGLDTAQPGWYLRAANQPAIANWSQQAGLPAAALAGLMPGQP